MGVRDVSGRATLTAFTLNQRFGYADFPPPFILAEVAIAEDPRVRLTTNIVDCESDELHIGQEVEVAFHNVDDVWLPLFRPADEQRAGKLPTDEIPLDEFPNRVRPTWTADKFERHSAITGIGASRLGRRLMLPALSLTVEACRAAIADAGLSIDDIDGLSTYPGSSVDSGIGEGGIPALEGALGVCPTWVNGGMDLAGPAGSVIVAMMAVATGLARHVLCFRTVWQATHAQLVKEGRLAPPMAEARTASWQMPFGWMSAAHNLALNAQRHFHRFGTTRETLGWIAINQRANAALNPTAIYRDPITMDHYMSARPITTPFGLFDCDVPCDGAVAVIVSAVDAAKDAPHKPVLFEAVGTQILERTDWDQSTLTHEPQVLGQAAHMWSRTTLRPDDVDVAELYDGFTFNCLSWLEALGFCGIGESKDFLDGGQAIARDGVIPVNTHGGQLSHGRTHGMGLVHEAVTQLRGAAGERQVRDARVAVVSSGGLTPSGVMLLRVDQ